MQKSLPFLGLLVVAAFVPVACSKEQPPPVAPTVDAGVWTDAGPGTPWMTPSASASAPPPMTSSSVPPAPSASASAPNVIADPTDAVIDLAIKTAANTSAPGMNPDGQPGRATLAEGEHFAMVVNLQPNLCYSVVGFSPAGGVAQLDVKLMAPPLYNIQAGASGANDKNTPVIGKGKANALCPLLPVAVPYKIDVAAKKGSGRIGVQLYSRAK